MMKYFIPRGTEIVRWKWSADNNMIGIPSEARVTIKDAFYTKADVKQVETIMSDQDDWMFFDVPDPHWTTLGISLSKLQLRCNECARDFKILYFNDFHHLYCVWCGSELE